MTIKDRPYEDNTEASKQDRAKLIVVESHGRSGIEKLLMSSVTGGTPE